MYCKILVDSTLRNSSTLRRHSLHSLVSHTSDAIELESGDEDDDVNFGFDVVDTNSTLRSRQ